jgi:hypothetical protein
LLAGNATEKFSCFLRQKKSVLSCILIVFSNNSKETTVSCGIRFDTNTDPWDTYHLIKDPDLDLARFFWEFFDANKKLVSGFFSYRRYITSVFKEFIFQHVLKRKGRIWTRIGINRIPIHYTVKKDCVCAGEPGAGSAQ